ncbi:hypothetical protein FH972_022942 [Carpinus fangiana]|uniref:peptidyl-tRNA hydrolase n=1 Tax=Carpinus fangiana TaxID=176857 RepID=A0A5N6KU77_9ROSI|nr:hypothetical protein FH972_022942 [Carpinus fangiana]
MADRPAPSTAAIAIATAIIGALGGYFLGQASSLGIFGAQSRSSRRANHSMAEEDSSSDDDDEEADQQAGDLKEFSDSREECKLVLVVRTDLGMTKGKIAAQASHATLACYKAMKRDQTAAKLLQRWERMGQAKVALQVKSEEELELLQAQAMSLGLCANIIHDAGRTQIASGSATVLGVGPGPKSVVDQTSLANGHRLWAWGIWLPQHASSSRAHSQSLPPQIALRHGFCMYNCHLAGTQVCITGHSCRYTARDAQIAAMADLDIEEVNRVRKSLGMAPLPSSNGSNGGLNFKPAASAEDNSDAESTGDLGYLDGRQAAAGDNWKKLQDEANAKNAREARLAKLKKERDAAQRYAKLEGKGLGDADEDDDQDARSWLLGQNKRKKKIDKARARMLQKELEDRENQAQYTEKDLAGARVGHELGDFEEGEQILTLKDRNVEDEDEEDELENAGLREKEKAKERLDLKKKSTVYNPMDDEEDPSKRSVLAQYDEEIDGKKKGKTFTLGATSASGPFQVNGSEDTVAGLSRQRFSLDLAADEKQPISDYMDISEIKVKKPKKKKDKSKSKKRANDENDTTLPAGVEASADTMDIDTPAGTTSTKRRLDEASFIDDDDLQSNLAAQRRVALKKRKLARPEDLARQLREEASATPMDDDSNDGGLVIDETTEFVANLQKPEVAVQRRKSSPEPPIEHIHGSREGGENDVEMHNGESSDEGEVKPSLKSTAPEETQTTTGLEDDSTLNNGIGAALNMLKGRGLITTADSGDINAQHRERQRFLAEKQKREAEGERKARLQRERDRASGKFERMSAREREQYAQHENKARDQADSRQMADVFNREYKPNVDLKYVDEFGRSMNQKEAFKHMSHQFHGKGSGKQKTEKMLKKIEDEKKREARSALDGSEGSGMGNAASVTQKKNRQAGVRLQ